MAGRVLLTTRVPGAPGSSWPAHVPDHYGFGVRHLPSHGYVVLPPPVPARGGVAGALRRLPARLGTRYGDLAVQAAIARCSRDADLVFDPWDVKGNVLALAVLRATGLLPRPLVAYVHSSPVDEVPTLQRPAKKVFFGGCDALPAMSPAVADELRRRPAWASKTRVVLPGPDAAYYTPSWTVGRDIVCVGKSLRDFVTLGRAASRTTARVHIVCPRSTADARFASFARNVRVTLVDDRRLLPREAVDALVRDARAVAIPLSTTRLMAGLWSLFDGLGFGKAVIMTRHPGVPLDIEGEGVGRWVGLADEDGWADALQHFEDNADDAARMGRAARAVVDAGFNSASFAAEMARVFDQVLERAHGRRKGGR